MEGERFVARVCAHPRSMVLNGLPLYYFRLPSAQPLGLAPMYPTDRYLARCAMLPVWSLRVVSLFFSLLLPLPIAASITIMAKRKATAEELLRIQQL